MEGESKYQDSLYSPQPAKDSLYGGPGRDSVYSGEEGGRYHRESDGGERGGRFSPRPRSKGWDSGREQRGENTFDHVSRGAGRRGQEERIWQDPVSRGAESGQIRAVSQHQSRSWIFTPDPVMFFDCGIHAREWISSATCLYLIQVQTLNRDQA